MLSLQSLRQTRTLARLVLAWFVLSIGVAVAAPVVQPEALSLVCSASGGSKLVSGSDDGTAAPTQGHKLGCVLCMAVSAPPPAQVEPLAHLPALSYVQVATPGNWITWRTHAPLPARGPPAA